MILAEKFDPRKNHIQFWGIVQTLVQNSATDLMTWTKP